MKRFSLPKSSVGVGLRAPYYPLFFNENTRPRTVDFVQVITENFMEGKVITDARPLHHLLKLREHLPVSLHGVSLSLGSTHDLDFEYLKKWKSLVDLVDPLAVSDHLCWTRFHQRQTHDLNPLPYTKAMVDQVAKQILKAQDFLKRSILIENVSSYLNFEASEMSEADFLTQVCEKADCGLLLDINNIYVSSVNHGFDAEKFLSSLPHHRVREMHLAGHTRREDGFLIDTHDQAICEAVWRLYRTYVQNYGFAPVLIERDAKIPEWSELEQECIQLKAQVLELQNQKYFLEEDPPQINDTAKFAASSFLEKPLSDFEGSWQQNWVDALLYDEVFAGVKLQEPWTPEARFQVYENSFWLRLEGMLKIDFPKLHGSMDADAWSGLVYEALYQVQPHSWTLADLGEVFVAGLKKCEHAHADAAECEWASLKANLRQDDFEPGVTCDFGALAPLDWDDLNKISLVLHPSVQWLLDKKTLVWYSQSARQQKFEDEEWQGLLEVQEKKPLTELQAYQGFFEKWVSSGIVYGWKKNIATRQ